MLNCTLLLDSAFRFGLMQGDVKFAGDALKREFRSVLCQCLNEIENKIK